MKPLSTLIALVRVLPALAAANASAPPSATPVSSPRNLMDQACDEKSRIAASKGRAQRRAGDELVVWLPGFFDRESAIVFRNASRPGQTTFTYCGGTSTFDLVSENFDHDSPMLYLVENNGRKRAYHLGEDAVYTTIEGRHVLATGVQRRINEPQASIIALLGAEADERAPHAAGSFHDELRCDLPAATAPKDYASVTLIPTRLTAEEAVIEANADYPPGTKGLPPVVGKLWLKAGKDGRWEAATKEGLMDAVKCR